MNAIQRDWDITTIEAANTQRGFHFFEAGAMRFFNSRVLSDVYQGPGGVYFVTSEKFNARTPRYYTVRQFNPTSGDVSTIGLFNSLSRYQAIKAANLAAQGAS